MKVVPIPYPTKDERIREGVRGNRWFPSLIPLKMKEGIKEGVRGNRWFPSLIPLKMKEGIREGVRGNRWFPLLKPLCDLSNPILIVMYLL